MAPPRWLCVDPKASWPCQTTGERLGDFPPRLASAGQRPGKSDTQVFITSDKRGSDGVKCCRSASRGEHLEGAGGCPTALPGTTVISAALEGVKMFPFRWDFQKHVTKLSNQFPRRKANNGVCLPDLRRLRWEPG